MTTVEERDAVLHAEDIHKSYAGIDALRGASCELRKGEIHALIGVEGSGKSSLVKIIAGVMQPDAGRLLIDGEPVCIADPKAAAALGIRAVHHEARLVPMMTVLSNILLDYAPHQRLFVLPLIDWRRIERSAREALEVLEMDLDLNARAHTLTLAQQGIAKIVRALAARPRILLLDEPTLGLSEPDVNRLFRAIRSLAAQGVTILYVSHVLNEIPSIVDRVTVLKEGRTLGTIPAEQADLRSMIEMLVAETSQAMALREADRLRREFVWLVSHELRTPLATIRGYAETVMSRTWSEEIRQECLQNIAAGCERLTELVDNLLDMSSLEKGTLRIEMESVSLPDIARRVTLALWRRMPRTHDVVLRFSPSFPTVRADPKRIEQVLSNLLDNAVKYCGRAETITVSGEIESGGREVVITVEDQGVGIPAEHLDRVFERFYRVPGIGTSGVDGSGLGLAICRGIIERHGGHMWVHSTPGQGSAFSFSLPTEPEDGAA